MLYEVLLGQEKGPRFGSFVALYGLKNTIDMIDGALARSAAVKRRKRNPWFKRGTVLRSALNALEDAGRPLRPAKSYS
jgi:hypothetical protein